MSRLRVQEVQDNQIPTIVDVRTPDEYARESIPGTRNIPFSRLRQSISLSPADTPIILSCRTGRRAGEAYELLRQLGFSNLYILEGGIEAWKKAGRPVNANGHRFSIMQQVQMIAGSLILLGSFYKALWFVAPVVGLGLLTAGLTNTCMMAAVLAKMPWNRISGNTAPGNCSL